MRSGLLAGIRGSVWMLKSHRSLCMSLSRTGAGLCIYHLFVWSNWNILHISQWITLPTQSYLALYSFCAICCIRLLCDWSSSYCLHLLFCCVLSILANYYHYNNNYYYYSAFFAPALTGGLSLKFERQQVSSGLQDSSQYCQQCCSLNGLNSSSDFKYFLSPFQVSGDRLLW